MYQSGDVERAWVDLYGLLSLSSVTIYQGVVYYEQKSTHIYKSLQGLIRSLVIVVLWSLRI